MGAELRYIHHVGHVVRDMSKALELYRKLGFDCPPPAYPSISQVEGRPAKPFGAANTHATFLRNFIELVTVISDDIPLPPDAVLIPLDVPVAALPRIREAIKRTVGTVGACLNRFEGLHILVFEADDVATSAAQFDKDGVYHSGVNVLQRQVETTAGLQVSPVRFLEIDQEPVPEGRLAIAENPPPELLHVQSHIDHPNGAYDLVESILCVSDSDIDSYVQRYHRYLGRAVQANGAARVFNLQDSRITILPASKIEEFLPGEEAPALPAFVAYAVKARDLQATETLLRRNEIPVVKSPAGDMFVPARAALGAAVIFRQ